MNINGLDGLFLLIIILFNSVILLLTNHDKKLKIRFLLTVDYMLLNILFSFALIVLKNFEIVKDLNILIASAVFTVLYDLILLNIIKILMVSGSFKKSETYNDNIAEIMIHLANDNKKAADDIAGYMASHNPQSEIFKKIKEFTEQCRKENPKNDPPKTENC